MINIVTGKINSQKTTRLKAIYEKLDQGEGFISVKTMHKDYPIYYDMQHLTTNQSKRFICRDDYCGSHRIKETIGPYHIIEDTFEWVEKTMLKAIENQKSPLYFDEVGLLEINQKGFYSLINKMIASNLTLYFVVRKDLVQAFLKTFNVNACRIIEEADHV